MEKVWYSLFTSLFKLETQHIIKPYKNVFSQKNLISHSNSTEQLINEHLCLNIIGHLNGIEEVVWSHWCKNQNVWTVMLLQMKFSIAYWFDDYNKLHINTQLNRSSIKCEHDQFR